nr:hypothetical protein [Candidatus Freyarchaeota archaeon]
MTGKWRMVTTTTDVADWYSGYIPSALRAVAEGKIPDTVAFYFLDRPAIFLQRYCDALRDINYEAAVENNVKITRGNSRRRRSYLRGAWIRALRGSSMEQEESPGNTDTTRPGADENTRHRGGHHQPEVQHPGEVQAPERHGDLGPGA